MNQTPKKSVLNKKILQERLTSNLLSESNMPLIKKNSA